MELILIFFWLFWTAGAILATYALSEIEEIYNFHIIHWLVVFCPFVNIIYATIKIGPKTMLNAVFNKKNAKWLSKQFKW